MARRLLFELPTSARARLVKRAQPTWTLPMLATLVDEPFSRDGWFFEVKLDGERCLAFQRGGRVQLFSRNHKLLNEKYPELVRAFEEQEPASFIADGEIVTVDHGITSFSKLQPRMQVRHPSEKLLRDVPVWFYVFDLLFLDVYDLRQVTLRYRKDLLYKALEFKDPLRFVEYREKKGEAYFKEACRKGWEGLIAKNAESIYVSKRSRDWLKFKCLNEQEFVVGGYTDPRGSRVGLGALLVGYYDHGRLKYAGKVGTGFDWPTLRRLAQQLAQLKTNLSPFAGNGLPHRDIHWVKPKLVAQIGFTEWTHDGKLRHPRFLGLRDDKNPEEVVRER